MPTIGVAPDTPPITKVVGNDAEAVNDGAVEEGAMGGGDDVTARVSGGRWAPVAGEVLGNRTMGGAAPPPAAVSPVDRELTIGMVAAKEVPGANAGLYVADVDGLGSDAAVTTPAAVAPGGDEAPVTGVGLGAGFDAAAVGDGAAKIGVALGVDGNRPNDGTGDSAPAVGASDTGGEESTAKMSMDGVRIGTGV